MNIHRFSPLKFLTIAFLSVIFTITCNGGALWLFSGRANAHSVAQIQTTKFFAPETVKLITDRAASGTPGLKAGDIISYIIQFTPIPNNASIGPNGYLTDYIPANTEVVGAAIVQPDGSGNYVNIPPDIPGPISNGWGPIGQQTYLAPFNTNVYDTTGLCVAASQAVGKCNGSLAQIYADTGIFYSTDPRTAGFYSPDTDGRIRQGTNGYNIDPTAAGQLNPIIGQSKATTHNQWDADQNNAFGSAAADISALTSPKSAASALIVTKPGRGATPFNSGSAVAGSDSGYKLDNTGNVGPWKRIAYSGSRIGNPTGPATSATGSYNDPVNSSTAVVGTYTNAGWSLSSSSPLPSGTNAVRWAVGRLVVGDLKYVKISLRLTANPPSTGLINNAEVYGGDSAEAAGKAGNDNPWRYAVPSVATLNSNLFVLKEVIKVNGQPSNGAVIPANAKVKYRIRYLNTGANPQANVKLSDTLPIQTGAGAVSNLSVISGSNILPISPASPSAGSTFSFQPIPSLNPGSGGEVEFDVQTTAAVGNIVTNKSQLVSDQLPQGVTSNAVSSVTSTATLKISKSATPTTIQANGIVNYTITVTNTGNAAASSIVVYDFLPTSGGALDPNTRFNFVVGSSSFTGITGVTPAITAPPNQVPYTSDNRQQVSWTFSSSLAAGASFTISFQAQAGSAVPTSTISYTNDARVTYNNGAASIEANAVSTAGVIVGVPSDLAITKTHSPNSVTPGSAIAYTLLVINNGPNPVTGATIADSVPNTIINTSWTCVASAGSSCGAANGTGNVISTTANLLVGGTATYTISGTISSTATGTIQNIATVTPPINVTDSNIANNTAQDNINFAGAAPQISLVKRITAINNTSLTGFEGNTTDPNNNSNTNEDINWPTPFATYLKGKIDGGFVQPNDEVEYTIYFLVSQQPASTVTICDPIPANQTFVATGYNIASPRPLEPGALSGDTGIGLALDSTTLPTNPTFYLTNENDRDRGRFFVPNASDTPATCLKHDASGNVIASGQAANTNGAIIVNLVQQTTQLPAATAPGTPSNSYGFIRFKAKVN